jgi:hypothetical protein
VIRVRLLKKARWTGPQMCQRKPDTGEIATLTFVVAFVVIVDGRQLPVRYAFSLPDGAIQFLPDPELDEHPRWREFTRIAYRKIRRYQIRKELGE